MDFKLEVDKRLQDTIVVSGLDRKSGMECTSDQMLTLQKDMLLRFRYKMKGIR